jgi:hypothetical protein
MSCPGFGYAIPSGLSYATRRKHACPLPAPEPTLPKLPEGRQMMPFRLTTHP